MVIFYYNILCITKKKKFVLNMYFIATFASCVEFVELFVSVVITYNYIQRAEEH